MICAAVFAINVDTTLVNVTLPTLVRELNASTTELQWIVDAYNLTFAAFVLAAGSLSDKFGRKGALLTGLALFGIATAAGSLATTSSQLIAARAVMGIGAAIVFPNTLSIISNVFTDRAERAKAIGAWGGVAGISIALGPITGGWLLEHFWWGSAFLAMAPVAAVAIALVALVVPTSRDPETPPLDYRGLALSTLMIATLVYTIIEGPQRGWTSNRSLAGFGIAAIALFLFVRWERRAEHPMLDVSLFANLRFSAASGAVTVSYFALFGFTFLITMYFQFLRGYGPLSTGLRILPVALAVGITSVTGTQLAVRFGNKAVVSTGLLLMATGFAWISRASVSTSYVEIVGQMLVVGSGMGLTSAPATEAIMGVVPKEKAGIGSAVNDATRELGGTLGVAVVGSVFASIYIHAIEVSQAAAILPAELLSRAKDSVGSAFLTAEALASNNPQAAGLLRTTAEDAYFDGFAVGCLVAAGVALVGAVFVALFLPARPIDELEPNVPAQRGAGADDVNVDVVTA
ncbi:MAG: MFS transporter [Mycobacteriales bacterium]